MPVLLDGDYVIFQDHGGIPFWGPVVELEGVTFWCFFPHLFFFSGLAVVGGLSGFSTPDYWFLSY